MKLNQKEQICTGIRFESYLADTLCPAFSENSERMKKLLDDINISIHIDCHFVWVDILIDQIEKINIAHNASIASPITAPNSKMIVEIDRYLPYNFSEDHRESSVSLGIFINGVCICDIDQLDVIFLFPVDIKMIFFEN